MKWRSQARADGQVFHNSSKQHIHLWTKGDWIIPQQRSVATWYCDTPRRAFVTLSTPFKSRIILFYLPRRPAEWKIFPSFSISSLLLTPRTLFPVHLLSNLCPLKDFYFYLLWHSKGPPPFDVMRVVSNQSLWDERHPHSPIQFKTKKQINILIFKWLSCFHNSFSNCCNCNEFCC